MSDSLPRPGKRRHLFVAAAASGLLLLSCPPALADDSDPRFIDHLQAKIQDVKPGQHSPNVDAKPVPKVPTPLPVVEDDDSPGHETPDPKPPDHASANGLEAVIGDADVAGVAFTDASMANDDSTTADATALSLGGNEILGAHADSDGDNHDSAGDPLEPVCDQSDGALCAALVYADADATEQAHSSAATSESGAANACVGGNDTTQTECTGPVGAGAIQSFSTISRTRDGHTRATSWSQVADLCVAPAPVVGTCTVGADVLRSEGTSDSRGTSTKQTQVLGVEVGGQQVLSLTDPTAIAVPPNCPSPSIACVFLNQGERYLGQGVAGHAAQALDATVLNGTILATVAQSETLVHKTPADPPNNPNPPNPPNGPGDGPEAGPPGPDDGILAETGGPMRGLLIFALFSLGLGGLLLGWTRRGSLAHGVA